MEDVRVLVAEGNPAQRAWLTEKLGLQRGIRVTGTAENGADALRMIREQRPQVVVCSLVMPQVDGYAVLEEVFRMPPGTRPKVIALTALNRDDFVTRAIELGASYYMVKPVDADVLAHRILSLAEAAPAGGQERQRDESAERAVADMLIHIGMPAHLLGYRFLLQSVMEVLKHPGALGSITHGLYPAVASCFDTTASRVERSIRHAISMSWDRGGARAYEQVLSRRAFSMDDKPTNCEMIALLAERVRLRAWE